MQQRRSAFLFLPTRVIIKREGRHCRRPLKWIIDRLLVPDIARRNQPRIDFDEQCAVAVRQIYDHVLDA